jgi:uncharacterized protein involved in type VI secretion and phage assembly
MSTGVATSGPASRAGLAERHLGKFRGIVTDNDDPRRQGRVRAKVPEVLGDVESGWAMPCAPYAGDQTGTFTVPAAGTGVWIEFEAGDVSRPVWVGCWWVSDKAPTDETGATATPDVRITRSEEGLMLALHDDNQTIALSDSNGANLLEIAVAQGQATLKATTKVIIEAPQIEIVDGGSHPAVFGDKLTTYLNQLVQAFNSHLHAGQVCAVGPVTPAPPAVPQTPPTPDLVSMKVRLG